MVLNKLVAFIYNLIGGRVHASARIKEDSSYVVMKKQEMSKMVEQGLASEDGSIDVGKIAQFVGFRWGKKRGFIEEKPSPKR
ncbi:hypothetical protein CCACVL1_27015 [Corchorus capsularis]|uniref:Uncharacterized protein n=1 Tax=Corchorus capsularis TaxID=210143 RepID=A0A1R3GCI2_COCAP|nr:hypothetical protein CCACVL1_27015 [Corchorus capsularis]